MEKQIQDRLRLVRLFKLFKLPSSKEALDYKISEWKNSLMICFEPKVFDIS